MKKREFDKFDTLARRILSVPHSEIKAKLEAEKKTKTERRKGKTKRPTHIGPQVNLGTLKN